jgi:hypothetical protein
MEEPRRPPHYRSAHTRVLVEEEDEVPPVVGQVKSGVRAARRILFFVKGVLAILVVFMFSLMDSPIRPYMVGTAIVMGLVVMLWPLLKKTDGH